MNNAEQEQVLQMLAATAEVMGWELKPNAALVMVEDLAHHDFQHVMMALTRCRRERSGRLTLSMVMEFLSPAGGWLTANEAWSLALPAADERNTVVWTREASKAWAVALPLLESGDKVGARMAFIGAYDRHVSAAKNEGRQPQHEVSAGWDASGRDLAIQQAQIDGLLPAPAKPLALPSPSDEQLAIEAEGRARVSAGLAQLAARMKGGFDLGSEQVAKKERLVDNRQALATRAAEYFDNLEGGE